MGMRTELKEMASGFRWGRRPLVPRSAEPYAEPKEERAFPTAWARTTAAIAARQTILKFGMKPLLWSEGTPRVYGLDNLDGNTRGRWMFVSNHASHLDATLIMTTLPDEWQAKTTIGAAKDYFFDVWWRQTFTALVYAAFPIDRGGHGRNATTDGARADRRGVEPGGLPGGRPLAGRACCSASATARRACSIEAGIPVVPIAIRGAYQAMPKGRNWPRRGRPPVLGSLRPSAVAARGRDAPGACRCGWQHYDRRIARRGREPHGGWRYKAPCTGRHAVTVRPHRGNVAPHVGRDAAVDGGAPGGSGAGGWPARAARRESRGSSRRPSGCSAARV